MTVCVGLLDNCSYSDILIVPDLILHYYNIRDTSLEMQGIWGEPMIIVSV